MSNTKSLISVITPVYNMEVLLPKCIDSILNQTYKNIELIIVDDGSTDNSGYIADEYTKKDTRVHVIHQRNKGIACALNTGMDAITGESFLFVDSDDYVAPEMVARLAELMHKYDADIVQCDRYNFKKPKGIEFIPQSKGKMVFYNTNDEILDDFFHFRHITRNLAARLFKTSLIDGVRCEPNHLIIDSVTLPKILIKCNKYVFVSEKYYYVYECPTSASRRHYSKKHWEDTKYGNTFIDGFVKEKCPKYIDFVYYRYVYTNMFAYLRSYESKTLEIRDEVMAESLAIYRKYYPIFKKTQRYKEFGLGYKASWEVFMKWPTVYRLYRKGKSIVISSLSRIKHSFTER